MNKNELVTKLKNDVQDLYSSISDFEKSAQVHEIEIDLALSKIRNLYELLLELKTNKAYKPENQEQELLTKTKPAIQDAPHKTPKSLENINLEAIKNKKTIIPDKEATVYTEKEDNTEKEDFIILPEKAEIDKASKNNIPDVKKANANGSNQEIMADKYQSKAFVNESMSKKKSKKDVSAKMKSKPILDISSAIGLNDKFIFIRELFAGDKDKYQDTIQVLNNFDNFENALDFLNANFDWDNEDPNFERLTELVRRKYS